MPFPRKTSFVLPLVVAVVGTAAFPVSSASAAHGAAGHPAAFGLAILPRRPRVRTSRRLARTRFIELRVVGRCRRFMAVLHARLRNLFPRLPLRDSYARGPPRPRVPASPPSGSRRPAGCAGDLGVERTPTAPRTSLRLSSSADNATRTAG